MKADTMNLFKKNLTAVEDECVQLTETNELLVAELAEAQAQSLPNVEEVATLTNANLVLQAKLDDAAEATAKLEEGQAALVIAEAAIPAQITAGVAKQIADAGLEQGKIDGNTDVELNKLEEMNLLEGDEAKAFFKENKSEILALHVLNK